MAAQPVERAASSAGLFDPADAAAWREGLDRRPFLFRHRLDRHPLFEPARIARLAALSVEKGDSNPYFSVEDRSLSREQLVRRMQDRIAGLGEGSHWVKIIAVDRLDPEYGELMRDMLVEVEALCGCEVRPHIEWAALTIFMNSPGLVVPYHFDHDTNFLMQVRGEKVVQLWDPSVVSQAELEDFYLGNMMAGRWRDELEAMFTPYAIRPGTGVHHPPHAPHRIRNGGEVAVSVSFYYTVSERVNAGRVHQANRVLRKLGVDPRPPGRSPAVDRVKSAMMNTLRASDPATWHDMMLAPVRRLGRVYRLARRVAG